MRDELSFFLTCSSLVSVSLESQDIEEQHYYSLFNDSRSVHGFEERLLGEKITWLEALQLRKHYVMTFTPEPSYS